MHKKWCFSFYSHKSLAWINHERFTFIIACDSWMPFKRWWKNINKIKLGKFLVGIEYLVWFWKVL